MMNEITISAKNNTNVTQTLSLFNSANPPTDVNAGVQYSFTLGTGGTLCYNLSGMFGVFVSAVINDVEGTYFAAVSEPTLQGLVDALNTLGLGVFYLDGYVIRISTDVVRFNYIDPRNITYIC